jgi:uncharacterized protein YaeQ
VGLKATIFKASLQVSDMDRRYYAEHSLTLARHPARTMQLQCAIQEGQLWFSNVEGAV